MEWIRSWRGWACVGAVVLIVILIGVYIAYSTPIKNVIVVGRFKRVQPACVSNALHDILPSSLLKINSSALKQSLQAQCPWIKSFILIRHWPRTVRLVLIERKAIAQWDARALVSDKGELFSPRYAKLSGLTRLEGPAGSYPQIAAFYQQAEPLLQAQKLSVKALTGDADGNVTLTLNTDIILLLGHDKPLATLKRFLSVDQSLFQSKKRKIALIDLRYPHGMAVQWAD
jgi:cell division protein FtsQ